MNGEQQTTVYIRKEAVLSVINRKVLM